MKQKIFFSLLTIFMISGLTACGGGGGGGTDTSADTSGGGSATCRSQLLSSTACATTPTTPVDPNAPVMYTTAEGMPLFVDYRLEVNNEGPVVRFNLSGGKFVEIDIWPIGTINTVTTEAGALSVSVVSSPGTSSAPFAGGFVFTYNGSANCTITTPSGETLHFYWNLDQSNLEYANPAGTTFKVFVNNGPPSLPNAGYGMIVLTVNGTDYGPLRYEPGVIDPTPGDAIGYSAEGGHKWGFDIQ